MVSLKLALGAFMSATLAVAHMELTWPYALRSKFNPNTPFELIDYSMRSPLIADGTYPCKGFIASTSDVTMTPVTTWSAGGTYNYTVEGTATHGGGSCQLAMSYDQGQSWQVIFSYIGGCLVEGLTTQFTLPADAPSGEALFSWNWFNQLGNREMYQNCAVVTITNGGSGLDPSVYPTPFVANAGVNDCTTIENQDVVFPEPGPNVRYGGAYAGGAPAPGTGIIGTNCYGPGERGGNTGSGSGSGSGSASASLSASSAAATGAASASAPVSASTSTSAWSEPSASASSPAWEASSASSSAWVETSSVNYASSEAPSASPSAWVETSSANYASSDAQSASPSAWVETSSVAYASSSDAPSSSSVWTPSSSSMLADPAATASAAATSAIGYEHAARPSADATSPSVPAPTNSDGKVCRPRTKKRAVPVTPGYGQPARRHERFIPRRMYEQAEREASGRVAALKAEHVVRS